MTMSEQSKVTRRISRAGQAILRKRGGFHTGTKYQRLQQQSWAKEEA